MRFWNLIPDAASPGDGVLDINGPIAAEQWFSDDCCSKDFVKALAGMRNVTVHINSPGGDVMAGAEMYSALLEHSLNGLGRITVIITALAASAASVVAMAGDEILISPVAYMMIHNPWSIACGDAKDLRKAAKTLDEIGEGIITAYQRRTGKSRDELKKMLDSETWMSAQKCVEDGFADGVYGGEIRAAACAGASMMTGETPDSIRQLIARWEGLRAEAPEKDPEEEPDGDPEREDADGEEPERDPDEPEEEPDEDPDKEDAKRDEIRRRAEIAARAAIAAAAMNYLEA